ncbi:MAG: DinB family protein [Bacteroidetes bacterium]|nr:MAG: DinB family protein [Bacteroidota bacterium]REK05725.1 MAG: DinB family protein [Bacteroidota bacterium]REK31969.1 MAG: DinB family protein [Bacteroidota bacterium]REK50034.1 MAG: DinB family protein [Bacteroidota bacterium]
MNFDQNIIEQLENNMEIFKAFFKSSNHDMILWKPAHEKWNTLEIVCHLYDEEREDFRARLIHVLENPDAPLPPIDPPGWVSQRNYAAQNFQLKCSAFLTERKNSVKFLRGLKNPKWDNAYQHPKFGPLSAKMFLANWLAHDYLHFRQLTRLRHEYLQHVSGEKLSYAGNW